MLCQVLMSNLLNFNSKWRNRMEPFVVKIKPLTPMWTGDVNKNCKYLRETGILGSLRWWYEAVVRGLGGTACDPTNSKCEGKKHCDACELFGCTGWARKFRLEVNHSDVDFVVPMIEIGTREMRKIRGSDKYLKRTSSGCMTDGTIDLAFVPLRDITDYERSLLSKTFEVIEKYGALGARISQGNGLIKIVENQFPGQVLPLSKLSKTRQTNDVSIDNFCSLRMHLVFSNEISNIIDKFWIHQNRHRDIDDSKQYSNWRDNWAQFQFLPLAYHIRDTIRSSETNTNTRHKTFGTGGRNSKGSKVFVSHAYLISNESVEIRIFGFGCDKEKLKNKLTKDEIRDKLFKNNEKGLSSVEIVSEIQGSDIIEGWLEAKQ